MNYDNSIETMAGINNSDFTANQEFQNIAADFHNSIKATNNKNDSTIKNSNLTIDQEFQNIATDFHDSKKITNNNKTGIIQNNNIRKDSVINFNFMEALDDISGNIRKIDENWKTKIEKKIKQDKALKEIYKVDSNTARANEVQKRINKMVTEKSNMELECDRISNNLKTIQKAFSDAYDALSAAKKSLSAQRVEGNENIIDTQCKKIENNMSSLDESIEIINSFINKLD